MHSRPLRMPFIPLWRETGQKWQASPMVTLQMNPEGVGRALGIVGGASDNMGGASGIMGRHFILYHGLLQMSISLSPKALGFIKEKLRQQ